MRIDKDEKLKTIIKRRNFKNFWECFDYLKLASYDELEALFISTELFNGNIWNDVITVAKKNVEEEQGYFASGQTVNFVSGSTYVGEGDIFIGLANGGAREYSHDSDNILVKIYYMTDESKECYKGLYKSYVETREYENIPELETHIKSVSIKLETELAIKMFNEGFTKFK